MNRRGYGKVWEIAEYLGLGQRRVWDLIHRDPDPIPHHRVGKVYLIRFDDVDQWMERRKGKSRVDEIVDSVMT